MAGIYGLPISVSLRNINPIIQPTSYGSVVNAILSLIHESPPQNNTNPSLEVINAVGEPISLNEFIHLVNPGRHASHWINVSVDVGQLGEFARAVNNGCCTPEFVKVLQAGTSTVVRNNKRFKELCRGQVPSHDELATLGRAGPRDIFALIRGLPNKGQVAIELCKLLPHISLSIS